MQSRHGFRQIQRLRRQRQRRRLLFLGALLVAVVAIGFKLAEACQPSYLVAIPPGFYRPDVLAATPEAVSPRMLKPLPVGEPDHALRRAIEATLATFPRTLKPHVFYLNLADHRFVDLNGETPVPAASVIKLPILLTYLQRVDAGAWTPSDWLRYEGFEQAGGSGGLQYKPPGLPISAHDVATAMIQASDNTCTNMLIYHLGGSAALNRGFERLGLTRTRVANWLPDLGGTNMVSMRDMATVLYNLQLEDVFSPMSRAAAFKILTGTHNRRLIPALLPKEAVIAHKTGDIGTSLGNAALVIPPEGSRYILAIQVERPFNDGTAKTLIQTVSKVVYDTVTRPSTLAQTHPVLPRQ